jgi:hypothetical protein
MQDSAGQRDRHGFGCGDAEQGKQKDESGVE